ncbi:MAG: CocE/NonD family hydrolase [Thiolinea sp.]
MPHNVFDPVWIPMPDGVRLAARIWMPDCADGKPLPAVLEFLPYRRRDGTAPRDESTYPVFAESGIVGIRVDQRGCGDSDGLVQDEYTEQELADAESVIAWIIAQDWSNGKVGMMGISWGGFNSLQVAYRHPPGLAAVISIGSTVDRYHDDIHYKGGAQLSANFSWATTMLCYGARPPEPGIRSDWRELWLERLEHLPFHLPNWLRNATRTVFWQHGSVGEDYSRMTTPALVISGWADGYSNAPPTAVANFPGVCKAINGPWIHKYPHFAWPQPRMDFHAEAIAWWQQWLLGEETQREKLPAYRAYIGVATEPGPHRMAEHGYWVETDWPVDAETQDFFLEAGGNLSTLTEVSSGELSACVNAEQHICTPQDVGVYSGEFFTLRPDADLSGDQQVDDARSDYWQTAVLEEDLTVLGRPVLNLMLSCDQPNANLCVRLVDVRPDGKAHRVSMGILNLAQRNSDQQPEAMPLNEMVQIRLALDECGYCFRAGHRIRIVLGTAYWPLVLPVAHHSVITLHNYNNDRAAHILSLPLLGEHNRISIPEPDKEQMLPEYIIHKPAQTRRWVEQDLQTGFSHYHLYDDTGISEHPEMGWQSREIREETYGIRPDDPLSAVCTATHRAWRQYGDEELEVVVKTELQLKAEQFTINWDLRVLEDGSEIFVRGGDDAVKREWL